MKNTLKYIAFGIAFLASSFVLNAQPGTYHFEGGMKTSKKVTGPEGGYYTIELESFATGETTVTETATPVDIVLVLDVSGSMDESMTNTYNERERLGYTYNSYGNNTYYYKHTDGNYYAVERWRSNYGYGNRFLRFNVNGTYWYLSGTDTAATTTQPTGTTTGGATIWTGVLYEHPTKMEALKDAVGVFIDEVNKNASQDSQGNPRNVDNRISIVKFAGLGNNNPGYYNNDANQYQPSGNGNHRNNNGYNYTEVVTGLTSVLNGGGTSLKNTVNGLIAGGATAANGGMQLAVNIISRIPSDRESNKVIVMFTDGSPTYQDGFQNAVARGAIDNARTLKTTYDATVYTIGVFDNETTQIRNYMTYMSSNYPNAQGPTDDGQYTPGTGSDQGYYQNASDADLNEIFKSIAHASGAADATAGASTQVRDVISNSFIMPEGEAAQITIYTSDITSDGEGWSTPVAAEGVSYEITTVTTSTGEEHKQLMVTGFDYTKADVVDPDTEFTITPGNWVGERYRTATDKYWAGKKLIISFKIQANDEATGGDGANTNHPDSGVYVQQFNEDGTPVIVDGKPVYSRVNQYDVPHTNLPLLIKITKDGLRTGESATFQIMRIRPKVDAEGNYVTNAIGKPEPNTHEFDPTPKKPGDPALNPDDPMDYLEGTGWEDWSKVILTNKGADKAKVEKDLYGLDPGWVYIVIEDDWGWAYTLTGSASSMTTSNTEINPFNFHNEPRTVNLEGNPIVKHAEAVTINHFETLEGEGAREEHYKSSKTVWKSTEE